MEFLKDFIEQNWESFLSYLRNMGIPEDEVEKYAVELLEKLE